MDTRGLYGEIRANRRRSLALTVVLGLVLASVGAALGALYGSAEAGLVVAALLAVALLAVAWYGGGRLTLAASGARRADPRRDRELLNVVAEMAIAAGLSPPDAWVIEDSAPNAFATGRDPEHAAVAVTTGLAEKLSRDELQAVVAHELAHVRNLDVRYMTLVAVTVGAIALLTDFAVRHLRWGGGPRRVRNRNAGGALVLVAVAVAILAPLSARLLQAAVSRRRETLADLSAAEMTRYPEALARALEKIEADPDPLEAANRATAPLYIVDPLRLASRADGLFRTHPPTEERVRLLRSLVLSPPSA